MIYTEQTRTAMRIAYRAHHGQLDKSGVPYVFHPIHLAEQMQEEALVTAALLHDVLEDTDITVEELRQQGIAEEVLEALQLLTHEPTVPYLEYVEQLAENQIARTVKLADLHHNSDCSRMPSQDADTVKRCCQYEQAIQLLEGFDG